MSLSQFAVSNVKSAANGAITPSTCACIHAVCSATINATFASSCATALANPASLALFDPLVGVLPIAGNAGIISNPSFKISVISCVLSLSLSVALVVPP